MSILDTNKSGFVYYTEFLKAALSEQVVFSSENLRRAFDLFDQQKTGRISASGLKRVLEGGSISDDQVWKDIIKSVDENSDGKIDLREFEEIIASKL